MASGWPSVAEVNKLVITSGDYLISTAHAFRVRQSTFGKGKKKGGQAVPVTKPTEGTIWVAKQYPQWQGIIMDYLAAEYKEKGELDNKAIAATLGKMDELKKHQKKVMPFVQKIKERMIAVGAELGLRTFVDFDEMDILTRNLSYLKSTLDVRTEDPNHNPIPLCPLIVKCSHFLFLYPNSS